MKYNRQERQAIGEAIISLEKVKYPISDPYELAWSLALELLSDKDLDLLLKVANKE